jgi:hypothetical protein
MSRGRNRSSRIFVDEFFASQWISQPSMAQHSRDKPDPQNIIPDDQKRVRNATDRAQGLDSYFKTVEATTKPRQAQG